MTFIPTPRTTAEPKKIRLHLPEPIHIWAEGLSDTTGRPVEEILIEALDYARAHQCRTRKRRLETQ